MLSAPSNRCNQGDLAADIPLSIFVTTIVLLATISWKDIASYYPKEGIFAAEPTREAADRPLLVFLGIDERGVESAAPDSSTSTNEHSSKVQKSLPEKREGAAYPEGIPYFVVDTTHHPELAKHAIELAGGDEAALFMDLRAELLCLDFESTGIAAEARALVDWNKRSEQRTRKPHYYTNC